MVVCCSARRNSSALGAISCLDAHSTLCFLARSSQFFFSFVDSVVRKSLPKPLALVAIPHLSLLFSPAEISFPFICAVHISSASYLDALCDIDNSLV